MKIHIRYSKNQFFLETQNLRESGWRIRQMPIRAAVAAAGLLERSIHTARGQFRPSVRMLNALTKHSS
jgi:hypothetical protein